MRTCIPRERTRMSCFLRGGSGARGSPGPWIPRPVAAVPRLCARLPALLHFSRGIFVLFFVPTWSASSTAVPHRSASQGREIHCFWGSHSPLDKPQWDSVCNPRSALDSPRHLFSLGNHWTPFKVPFSNEAYIFRLDSGCSHVWICLL